MAGPVEAAVRAAISPGDRLATPSGRGRFTVARYTARWAGAAPQREGSLDEHLKTFLKTATAGWIAVVLEKAGVITVDRGRPARIKLCPGW